MDLFRDSSIGLGKFLYFDEKSIDRFNSYSTRCFTDFNCSYFLLLIGHKSIKEIQRRHWRYIAYTAILGTFIPVFLFAYAVSGIDSSIASILNSLTPFNTLIFGASFFGFTFKKQQLIGILIGLIGTIILILKGADLNPNQNYWFSILIIIASIGYAFNVNIVKKALARY